MSIPALTRFPQPLNLEYLDGRQWRVTSYFTYRHPSGTITVPAGFLTDFASVPRFFWRLFPPTGEYGLAAVVHDFLYAHPARRTRADVDSIFLDAMTDLGVGWWTRKTMYRAVRMFGQAAWNTHHT